MTEPVHFIPDPFEPRRILLGHVNGRVFLERMPPSSERTWATLTREQQACVWLVVGSLRRGVADARWLSPHVVVGDVPGKAMGE